MVFSQQDIEAYIPQRRPFLFIDRILRFVPHQLLQASVQWGGDEAIFAGHFPGRPILPGVILLEAMLQTANFGLVKSHYGDLRPDPIPLVLVGMVKRLRFFSPVLPPVSVLILARQHKVIKAGGIFSAVASLNEAKVAEAEVYFSWSPTPSVSSSQA